MKPIVGLVPAAVTPLTAEGDLDLARIEPLVERLIGEGAVGFFVCGSTGEGPCLTGAERRAVAAEFVRVAGDAPVIVHVGHASCREAGELAAHAQEIGAAAVAAAPPTYFRPSGVEQVVASLAPVAAAAPKTPCLYYHIPSLTGVSVDMLDVCTAATERIPNFGGMKFTHTALADFAACADASAGRWQLFWGIDEMLLAALGAGAAAAVGSTYNLTAPVLRRVCDAQAAGDHATAHAWQLRASSACRVLARHGIIQAVKAALALVGFEAGPNREPLPTLDSAARDRLAADLDAIGFFDWRTG